MELQSEKTEKKTWEKPNLSIFKAASLTKNGGGTTTTTESSVLQTAPNYSNNPTVS